MDASSQISELAEEFNRLVEQYKQTLPHIHPHLTEEQLQKMAHDSAYMQMHMEGKV